MSDRYVLPDSFDPEANLLKRVTENGVFHESRGGPRIAFHLVESGHPEDLDLAHKVLNAALACQETREGDPHHGNFFWMTEDDVVGDLNAVEFCLEHLIPLMSRYGDRLKPEMQERVREAIRLGLDEIRRLDVRVTYSNITMLDILNTCLGGELLGDDRIATRGYDKLRDWIAYTDRFGIPREYNSPTYTSVIINALKLLVDYASDEATQVRARTFAARLGLTVGLHVHPVTGRWAAPHSRAYHPSVVCESPPELGQVRNWIERGALPSWTTDILSPENLPFEVRETASEDATLSTHMGLTYDLGVTSHGYGGQSDVLMAHYHREGAERPGVLYARYLTNDKWLGDFYHATDRTKSRNLIDEGKFHGVQNGPQVIGVYTPQTPPPGVTTVSSAKAAFIWTQRDGIDTIAIDGQTVSSLPVDVPDGATLVIASGTVLFGIRTLSVTDVGRNAPIRLVEREGDLVLEIYNYLGPAKSFWELRPDGPFHQGHPKCGLYLEMAERDDHTSPEAFSDLIASGSLTDTTVGPNPTLRGPNRVANIQQERPWTVEYTRAGRSVGIEVDLMTWGLRRRWTEHGDLDSPMLQSPCAIQSKESEAAVAGAAVRVDRGPVWIYGDEHKQRWVAGYHGPEPTALSLELPDGRVRIERMAFGTVTWDKGVVTVDAFGIEGAPAVEGGSLA